MAYVPVPKDLSKVKTKVAFGLTKRQLICFGAAALIGVPLFFLLKDIIPLTAAMFLMVLIMVPGFLFAMYERNGQPLEAILKNVITIPQNSDVYRAYYQSSDFTVLSDAYAIKWNYNKKLISRNQYLFMVMCINKVTDLPIYSYKNKLGGWNVVKGKSILLPQKDGEIDLEYMENFITAIQKLTIKSVVEYTNSKIAATKKIIHNNIE